VHTDNNFLKYVWACICKRGRILVTVLISTASTSTTSTTSTTSAITKAIPISLSLEPTSLLMQSPSVSPVSVPFLYKSDNFEGENFFLLKYGVIVKLDENTLFYFPENEEHGTTIILPGGYQAGISQNISKKK